MRLAILAGAVCATGQTYAGTPVSGQAKASYEAVFATTVDYVVQFYPLWFTYYQSLFAHANVLVGPVRVSPLYQIVVAINDDTLYASTFVDVTAQPVIVTVPQTKVTYSILTLDPYTNVFPGLIPAGTPGAFALTGPGFAGKLPANVTQIKLPYNNMELIFRADKHPAATSSSGSTKPAFTLAEAEAFRASLRMATLSAYKQSPENGGALILPEAFFAAPYKTAADGLIAVKPVTFLQQLQTAVMSSKTPAMPPALQALSDKFNTLFGSGDLSGNPNRFAFAAGAQSAHSLILSQYLTHTGSTNWINYTNIGAWGNDALQRSSIVEFIEYANNHSTAAYYQTFSDSAGRALDGSDNHVYVLTFPKDNLPEAKRFWSITAYTPESVELIRNTAHKYEVASYTRGLQYNTNGSLSIYMSEQLPAGVPMANWLPVTSQPFNLMLRFYGDEGSVLAGDYVPPAVKRQ